MIDVIVVGGGHAGIEAALATSRMGKSTVLITLTKDSIGSMPCNPSVGGPAKGIVVREIDALGGQMGITTDQTALQFKMLNTNKGPGVQSLRVQSDKDKYSELMIDVLSNTPNLEIVEEMVTGLLCDNKKVIGIKTNNRKIFSKIVILTTGTFMDSKIMVSSEVISSGPDGLPTTKLLSQSLNSLGIQTFRLKTGTPPRVLTNSINHSVVELQPGSQEFLSFSFLTTEIIPPSQQLPCYLTHTNGQTHKIIRDNLNKSSMYSGVVKGVGPRYCPSIEDKLVRFADKERHQIFLEPETADYRLTYVQGFSTSLPYDVQDKMLRTMVGLENAIIEKYAYAIEYDAINPLQLKNNLELRDVENLFCAGQINGTSGYEEAAGQGLMAGINASLKIDDKEPFVLGRDEAYIGVMIDDLVTKGTQEPYRLLTSRAEYRLLLRHDNADRRLTEKGYQVGLVKKDRYDIYLKKIDLIEKAHQDLTVLKGSDPRLQKYWETFNWDNLPNEYNLIQVLKRPHVEVKKIKELLDLNYPDDVLVQIDIACKYEGYIAKAIKDANKVRELDNLKIPLDFDYQRVEHLSLESASKLKEIRPQTLGQASRISGVNPSDIATLLLYLKK